MVIKMNYKENTAKTTLKKNLMKLDKRQLKLFFSIIVHYWLTNKSFISKMNFFHMWCKLNDHCSMVDATFPDPHIDHKLTTAYCQAHPFYFIDMLEPELVINLFCEYLDTRIDILTMVVNKLITGGIKAAYEYSNKVLDFGEDVDKLVIETEAYVSCLS